MRVFLGGQLDGALPRRGPGAVAITGVLPAAFRRLCNDAQFVKNFILIREWEGENQKLAVLRAAQKLQEEETKFHYQIKPFLFLGLQRFYQELLTV